MYDEARAYVFPNGLDVGIIGWFAALPYWSAVVCRFYVLSLSMNFSGIILGLVSFLCIGFFHPLVIKGEYYFGTKCWWVFALVGVLMLIGSLLMENIYFSVILGVISFSCFWSILELFEQKKRVERGWFPKNPRRRS